MHEEKFKQFKARLEKQGLKKYTPGDPVEARAVLLEIVDREIAVLKKIEAELQEQADAKAKEWAKESSFDGSKTGEQIHRRHAAYDRMVHRNMAAVHKARVHDAQGWGIVRQTRERRKSEKLERMTGDQRLVIDESGTVRPVKGYEGDVEEGLARYKEQHGEQPVDIEARYGADHPALYAVPGFFKWNPPVGRRAEAGGGVVERGDGGAAVGQEPPSTAAVGEGTGEVPGNGGVPVVLVGTGERARFQNELPDRGDRGGANQDGGRTTDGGGREAGVIGEVAAERREGRCDAEHRPAGRAAGGHGACSTAASGEGTGEVPENGGVPVVLVGTGGRARIQNELPDRGDGWGAHQDGGWRTEGGGSQAGVFGEVAAERQEGRSDAEHRDEEGGAEAANEEGDRVRAAEHRNEEGGAEAGNEEGDCGHAAERREGRSDAEHRHEGELEVPATVVGDGERAAERREGRFDAEHRHEGGAVVGASRAGPIITGDLRDIPAALAGGLVHT